MQAHCFILIYHIVRKVSYKVTELVIDEIGYSIKNFEYTGLTPLIVFSEKIRLPLFSYKLKSYTPINLVIVDN